MSRIRAFFAFLYDFVVGDDPSIAVLVVVAFGATTGLCASGINAWWALPLAALGGLGWSIRRASRTGA
jgi:hypothetical protein